MPNVLIGDERINGVDTVKIKNADDVSNWVSFANIEMILKTPV